MTTYEKIALGMVGTALTVMCGVTTFFQRRIDKRSEAEFQAYMRNLETRVESLEIEETDE